VVGSIVILAGHTSSSNFLDIFYTSGSKGLTELLSKTLGHLELVYAFITLVLHKNSRSVSSNSCIHGHLVYVRV